MKQAILPVLTFLLIAFAVSWLATHYVPVLVWQHIDVKEILTGCGPVLAGLVCYFVFKTPNTYRLSLAGSKPLVSCGLTALALLLPVLLSHKTDKTVIIGTVITQFLYTLGEESGWRHYLQNATSGFSTWAQALVIGTVWFFWHYAVLSDPTTMLTGQSIPFYIGMPVLILLLVLVSALFGRVVLQTQAVLLPTIIHYIGKVGDGTSVLVIIGLVIGASFVWQKRWLRG